MFSSIFPSIVKFGMMEFYVSVSQWSDTMPSSPSFSFSCPQPMCFTRPSWKIRGEFYTEYGVYIRCVRTDQSATVSLDSLNNHISHLFAWVFFPEKSTQYSHEKLCGFVVIRTLLLASWSDILR